MCFRIIKALSESQNLANAANNQNHNVNHRTVVKMQGIYQWWVKNFRDHPFKTSANFLTPTPLLSANLITFWSLPPKRCWCLKIDGPLAKNQFTFYVIKGNHCIFSFFNKQWSPKLTFLNLKDSQKKSVDFWNRKSTLKVRFWHCLLKNHAF